MATKLIIIKLMVETEEENGLNEAGGINELIQRFDEDVTEVNNGFDMDGNECPHMPTARISWMDVTPGEIHNYVEGNPPKPVDFTDWLWRIDPVEGPALKEDSK